MLRLIVDENFNERIVRGVLLRNPDADLVRVQDVGLSGANDADVLQFAAEKRVLLTHDRKTIPKHAYARIASGLPMPGVFVVGMDVPIRAAIDDILLLVECSLENEWDGQVRYLPL